MNRDKNIRKKIVISIVGIIVLIFLFKLLNNLTLQVITTQGYGDSKKDFWSQEITIKNGDKLNMTPEYLFKTMPTLSRYPMDNIVYFNFLRLRQNNSKLIVTATIVQNGETLFKNQYYFKKGNKLYLTKIVNEDLTTGEIRDINNPAELKSLLEIYKDFINAWLLSPKHQEEAVDHQS